MEITGLKILFGFILSFFLVVFVKDTINIEKKTPPQNKIEKTIDRIDSLTNALELIQKQPEL